MAIQKKTRQLLVILIIASFFNGIGWSGMMPMWQTPDEQAHFAQAQDIAAIGYRPNPGASTSQDIVLSEKYLGTFRNERGNNRFTYHPEFNIEYTNSSIGMYENELINFPDQLRTTFVINEATGYPPLYYWFIASINRLLWGFDLIIRVFVSRIATVLLTSLAVYIAFRLGKEMFNSNFSAIAVAGLTGFHPMWKFVGSGITSDALFNLVYPSVVLAGILFYRRPDLKRLVLLSAAVLAVVLTKPQSVLLFFWLTPIVLISVFCKNSQAKTAVKMAVTAGLFLGAIILAVNLLATFTPRLVDPLTRTIFKNSGIPDVSVYQSNRPLLGEYLSAVTNELYTQTFPWYWGVYRWLSLTLPLWIYRVIKIIILASLFGWVVGFKRLKNIVNFKPVLWLMASSVAYTIGIYAWNLLFWKSHGFPFGIQGRYFFPNLPEHMIILLAGFLLLVPQMLRKAAGIFLSAGMMIFNWYSLLFVSESYYGSVLNWKVFFLRASQYKPWFFKLPFLPFILAMGILTSGWFLWKLVSYTRSEE